MLVSGFVVFWGDVPYARYRSFLLFAFDVCADGQVGCREVDKCDQELGNQVVVVFGGIGEGK